MTDIMSEEDKTYKLNIYNDAMDETKENGALRDMVSIYYESKTTITYSTAANQTRAISLSLFGLSFIRRMFQPGHILAEVQITPSGTIPTVGELQSLLLRKKVQLTVKVESNSEDTLLADNYYIHEIAPLYEKNGGSTSIYLRLSIYSMDNLMRLNAFSQAYLGRRLCSQILLHGINDYYLQSSQDKNYALAAEVGLLQHLMLQDDTNKDEFRQPYLVQYNESFYDFLARTANRCGEFLYFEDGKLHAGLQSEKLQNIKQVNDYTRLTFSYATDGPLSVKLYTHDSVKNESEDPATAKSKEPSTKNKSTFNIDQHHDTGAFPSLDSTKYEKIYNSELAPDEFFMPLYRDQFDDGFLMRFLKNNIAELVTHLLKSLSQPTIIDIISDNALHISLALLKAALAGDKANEKGNAIIDTYAPQGEQEASMAVPYAPNDRNKWVALRYYRDIKANAENLSRQTVCVDMGASCSFFQLGDVVKFDNDNRLFLVIGIEMQSDQLWQRSYDEYGSPSATPTSDSALKFYAIPAANLPASGVTPLFYPPVLPSGVFRASEPQHAIVVDSNDPKGQGRVRIRYPWQQDLGDKDTEGSAMKVLNDALEASKARLDALNAIDTSGFTEDQQNHWDQQVKQCAVDIYETALDIEALAEAATPWIRMATPMATKGGGVFFKPEKGDEVLVNYENGNIERPYVVGALYSKNVVAPDADRIIMSRNGHYIKMDDPKDVMKLVASFLPGIGLLSDFKILPSVDVGQVNEDQDSGARKLFLGATRNLLGGITLSDSLGLCSITTSTHGRKIAIQSAIGNVTIDALTGISINAPQGDIHIEGKNVEILADNKLTIMSGRNLIAKKTLGATKAQLANTLANRIDDMAGKFLDLSFIRTIVEIFLFPVNGTMEIKSLSFLVLEAGPGIAEIPATAYTERALANKMLRAKNETTMAQGGKVSSGSAYRAIAYVAATISNANFANHSKEIARLHNDVCDKFVQLRTADPIDGNQRIIFMDGAAAVKNLTSKDFVEKCLESSSYRQLAKSIEWTQRYKGNKELTTKVEAAYKALRAMKNYCDSFAKIFSHTSALESKSVYAALTTALQKTLDDDKLKDLDWIKKIKSLSNPDHSTNLFSLFVSVSPTIKALSIDTNTHADYSDAGIRKFQRCLCYHFLGDSNPGAGGIPVNDVDFVKNRMLKIDRINQAPLTSAPLKSKDDIINGTNGAWTAYINSMTLKDDSEDKSFLSLLKDNLAQKLDDKFTFSPDRDVWNADVKGRILLSESSETVSMIHSEGGGSVTLKGDANSQFNAKTIDAATQYLRNLFIPLG